VFPEGAIVYNAITKNITRDNPILNVIADDTLEKIDKQPPKPNSVFPKMKDMAPVVPEKNAIHVK